MKGSTSMKKKKNIKVFLISGVVFLVFIHLFGAKGLVSEKGISTDIERKITRTLKESKIKNSVNPQVRIELFEDISNKRFVLYSFYNSMTEYRHTGYAVYEIKDNSKFKRTDFGFNSSVFNTKELSINENGETRSYLVAYGMNKDNETQVYEYTYGSEKRVEEFSGEFFLKSYPLNGNNIEFTSINR
jgi:hypothetical protein